MVAEKDEAGAIRLNPDPRHCLPGRGAWLHPTGDCLEQALRRRAFGRALRTSAAPDPAAVVAHLEALASGHPQGTEKDPPEAHGNRP